MDQSGPVFYSSSISHESSLTYLLLTGFAHCLIVTVSLYEIRTSITNNVRGGGGQGKAE